MEKFQNILDSIKSNLRELKKKLEVVMTWTYKAIQSSTLTQMDYLQNTETKMEEESIKEAILLMRMATLLTEKGTQCLQKTLSL